MKQDTLEGRAKTKNGVKRLCFSGFCILLEVLFAMVMLTKLNRYAEFVNLLTRILAGGLVLGLYASNKTSFYENAMDNFDTYISDNGSWSVLDDWIKRRNS